MLAKKLKSTLAVFVFLLVIFHPKVAAQGTALQVDQPQQFYKAKVSNAGPVETKDANDLQLSSQKFSLKILNGDKVGQTIEVEDTREAHTQSLLDIKTGDTVVITNVPGALGESAFSIIDKYRLNIVPYLLAVFFLAVVIVARAKGVGSLVGMAVSLLVISQFIVPQIISGTDPLAVTIVGALIILFVTTYLAHGVSKQTTIALISTFLALIATAIMAVAVVKIVSLFGLGTEDVASFQLGATTAKINLQGLLLSGIIIGALGALNDITTTQATTILELAKSIEKPKFATLFKKGFAIGREHIVSLVNTLVLAYAGSSMALFIFISLNPGKEPLWVILNSETIMDEAAKAIIGSLGLMLSVPLVTALAAWYFSLKTRSN